MNKNVILYFSHDKENYVNGVIKKLDVGNTKVIAEKIQTIIKGDIFEIQTIEEYPYLYNDCTNIAKTELKNNARPKIKDCNINIDQYENVYIGYPNWWNTMPMCIWTFLEKYILVEKNIYPFCTHEGSGLGTSVQDLSRLCPLSQIHEGLAIKGSNVENADATIMKWLESNRNI